jgi:hypothetical protein
MRRRREVSRRSNAQKAGRFSRVVRDGWALIWRSRPRPWVSMSATATSTLSHAATSIGWRIDRILPFIAMWNATCIRAVGRTARKALSTSASERKYMWVGVRLRTPTSGGLGFLPVTPTYGPTTLPTNLATWPNSSAAWAELKMPCLHANLAMDLADRLPGCLINEL